jgi:hypothetical protein
MRRIFMKIASLKKAFITASILAVAGNTGIALAHSGGATIDSAGNNPRATDLAAVTCFDDGGGAPHHLTAQVKDMSAPVSGLLLSLHLFKGNQMTSITDTVSGDRFYSPTISLNRGAGVYYMSVTKTKAGRRSFDIIWHCMTSGNQHTGTDIQVLQFQ